MFSAPVTSFCRPDKIAGWVSACVVALRPAATYSLRLIATNYVGHSPYSDPLVFTTLEEGDNLSLASRLDALDELVILFFVIFTVPAAAPQNVQVRPVGSVELHVSWLVSYYHLKMKTRWSTGVWILSVV